jgi:hypothetical protein
MATILELYKNATKNVAENELYGKDSIRIESKGLLNPQRQTALLVSSPNAVADLIGGQAAGFLGGNANRPSDTIFPNDRPFSKPITVVGGTAVSDLRIKDTVEAGKQYFVKQNPSPASVYQRIKQGSSSPLNTATNIAAEALRNPLARVNSVRGLAKSLKSQPTSEDYYGPKFTIDQNGKKISETKKFSEYFPVYDFDNTTGDVYFSTIKKRENKNNWDTINNQILNSTKENSEKIKFTNSEITRVEIIKYGNESKKLILPGTITGLSEDFSPEWNNFRYIGSPFNVYRYAGVERSIKFNFKMYHTDSRNLMTMKRNLDELRTLVYPYEELSAIIYGEGTQTRTEALAFSPNLVYFSITGLYNNLFGFVDELSFTIDDNISWATEGMGVDGIKSSPYPTVFDVSIGFKVIPKININKKESKYTYTSSFNDYGDVYINTPISNMKPRKRGIVTVPEGTSETFAGDRSSTKDNLFAADR